VAGVFSRRSVAAALLLLPAVLAGTARGQGCYDPATLPLSQRSRRRSLGFKDQSTDPAKRCGICAFFTAAGDGCGTCRILGGGAVNSTSVCNSWAKKA
jgi:hypothetical protein